VVEKENNKMKISMTIAYLAVRLSSYMITPRPYLWWHGLLDATVLFCFIVLPEIIKKKIKQ
jgi:hypothetical protein